MNTLSNFVSPVGTPVRVIVRDGEPWFVAKDVADALGYQNTPKAVADHCKKSEIFKDHDSICLRDSKDLPTSPRGFSIIPEADVYRLVMRSNLPSAEVFQDWVCEEVLPSIRKTGMYGGPKTLQESLRAYADLLDMNERNQRLALEAQAKVAELADNILATEAQRDKAIREKAQINSSRVGTCMRKVRTANEAKRKVEAENGELKIKLGESTSWKTVTTMEPELRMFFYLDNRARQFIGKTLVNVSNRLGLQIKKAADARYGQVNAYHEQAWDAFIKGLTKPSNAEFMKPWRRG